MKTVKQIERKITTLQRKLSNERICENFGDKEQRELQDFIGFIYDYCGETRTKVLFMQNNFNEWCYTYNG